MKRAHMHPSGVAERDWRDTLLIDGMQGANPIACVFLLTSLSYPQTETCDNVYWCELIGINNWLQYYKYNCNTVDRRKDNNEDAPVETR
jgi:hypothetical protein